MEFAESAKYEERAFYRWLAQAVLKYFEDPVVQKEFKKWQKEQRAKAQQQESEVR